MNGQRILIVLLMLLSVYDIAAQEFAVDSFDHYTKNDGLSNNDITGLAQDAAGYMWIATSYGVNRYNGSRFVQYHSNDDSTSLPSEEVTGTKWLDKNRLGIYTINGLHVINTKTGEARNLFIPYHRQQYLYKFNVIMEAAGDEYGNTYVLTRSGFYQFDKDYRLVFRYDYYSDEQVFTEHFFFGGFLIALDNRRLLIISTGGLYIYNKEKRQIKKAEAADCPIIAEFLNYPSKIYIFFQQKPGGFFVLKADSDTLVYINVTENKKVVSRVPFNPISNELGWRSRIMPVSDTVFYVTSHYSGFFKMRFYPKTGAVKFYSEKQFDAYSCSWLLKDKDDNLWIATNKGVFRQNPRKAGVQLAASPAAIEASSPNLRLIGIQASANDVYVGSGGQAGLLQFDKKDLHFKKQFLFDKKKLFGNTVYCIDKVDSSTLMVGTDNGLFLFDEHTGKEHRITLPQWFDGEWMNDLYKDSKGDIWISSNGYVFRYHPASGDCKILPLNQKQILMPVGLHEDKNGNMWMASHGLFRYNTVSDSIDLVIDSFPFIKMPSRQLNAFIIDDENTVWLNPLNNGLIAYNITDHKFRHFTRHNGLPDDNILAMIIIDKQLWIATYSGIACMDLRTSKIISFGKEDGFSDMPVSYGTRFYYDSTSQFLYIGFSKVFARFNPHHMLQKKISPQVFIESVMTNGQNNHYLPGEHITTSWDENEITVTIGSINFSDGYSQAFAYRLIKDHSTRWQQLGNQPTFTISNLSPGTHHIQLKCFSLYNRWPAQIRELTIVVLPPFWMERGFIALFTAILFLLIYLLVQWRINTIRKQEKAKTHLQKLKADDYKNQFELEQISNYFSSSLADKKTEEEVLWDVTHNLMARLNYEDCIIYMWNKDKTKMVQRAAYGPKGKPEIISENVFEVLPGQGIVGQVIQTRHPLLVNDTRKDSRYRVDDAFRLSEVTVPIIHNNELLGVLDSEHSEANYYSERDIKIFTTIATLIGNRLKQIESDQSLEAKRQELASINEQLAEARLEALQAQMNPHFVFNALNSIKRMILDGDNEKASRYLSKFALMIRMTLEHSKEIFVTLDENIKYLKAYLEMEQLRFDESFTYSIIIDENLDESETPIPSLMIQPLVENAIWHGLMLADGNKKITAAFTQHDNKITCTIEDNGIGIRRSEELKELNKTPHRSHGLENLKNRIKIMNEKYDTACSLEITDIGEICKDRSGTRVVLRFNIINI